MTAELLTVQEAAAVLRVSVMTIYRLRQAGELPYIDGPRPLIRRADIDAYLERKTTWHARAGGHISPSPSRAETTKSGGAREEDLAAAQRAQEIVAKLKRSSRISSS
ncbi:MAG: helix-turn-helix domain-containing protein [Novosphingobium sp.]|nr:helix-turn-helix domain-containing protein [Novosphingobium sp.]